MGVQLRPPPARTGVGLARRVERIGARGRLDGELRSIALDQLGSCEPNDRERACTEWVSQATQDAISTVSRSALEALTRRLEALLDAVPSDIARDLDRARARREAGLE